ncbi:hypothetical protein IW139_004922, partial [Coemansia sp. RSA 353]
TPSPFGRRNGGFGLRDEDLLVSGRAPTHSVQQSNMSPLQDRGTGESPRFPYTQVRELVPRSTKPHRRTSLVEDDVRGCDTVSVAPSVYSTAASHLRTRRQRAVVREALTRPSRVASVIRSPVSSVARAQNAGESIVSELVPMPNLDRYVQAFGKLKIEVPKIEEPKVEVPKPEEPKPRLQPESKWECAVCEITNPDSALKCMACETAKPGSQPETPVAPSLGGFKLSSGLSLGSALSSAMPKTTTSFGFNGFSKTPSASFKSFVPPGAAPAAPSTASATSSATASAAASGAQWTCEVCDLKSPDTATECQVCEAKRPGAPAKPSVPAFGSSGFQLSSGKSLSSFAPSTQSTFGLSGAKPSFGAFVPPGSTAPAVSTTEPLDKGLEWTCEVCDLKSPDTATECQVCEAKRPGAPAKPTVSAFGSSGFQLSSGKSLSSFAPSTQSTFGLSGAKPSFGAFVPPGSTAPAVSTTEPLDKGLEWTCEVCELRSPGNALKCTICEADKPSGARLVEKVTTFAKVQESGGGSGSDAGTSVFSDSDVGETDDGLSEVEDSADEQSEVPENSDDHLKAEDTADEQSEVEDIADVQSEVEKSANEQPEVPENAGEKSKVEESADEQPEAKENADKQSNAEESADVQPEAEDIADDQPNIEETADELPKQELSDTFANTLKRAIIEHADDSSAEPEVDEKQEECDSAQPKVAIEETDKKRSTESDTKPALAVEELESDHVNTASVVTSIIHDDRSDYSVSERAEHSDQDSDSFVHISQQVSGLDDVVPLDDDGYPVEDSQETQLDVIPTPKFDIGELQSLFVGASVESVVEQALAVASEAAVSLPEETCAPSTPTPVEPVTVPDEGSPAGSSAGDYVMLSHPENSADTSPPEPAEASDTGEEEEEDVDDDYDEDVDNDYDEDEDVDTEFNMDSISASIGGALPESPIEDAQLVGGSEPLDMGSDDELGFVDGMESDTSDKPEPAKPST